MEVSSHALALDRVYGITFHTAVFTNLTRDHLDFHSGMDTYFAAKKLLFAPRRRSRSALGRDQPRRSALGRRSKPRLQVIRYGFDSGRRSARVRARDEFRRAAVHRGISRPKGASFARRWWAKSTPITSWPHAAQLSVTDSIGKLSRAESPIAARSPAVSKSVDQGQPFLVVVDYAHTDDALRSIIAVARELQPKAGDHAVRLRWRP